MAITADFQAELRGLTVGALTAYPFVGPVGGLGVPRVRSHDATPPGRAGNAAVGVDYPEIRTLDLPVGIDGTSMADTIAKLHALKAAWRPADADLGLDLRLPGQPATILRYFGRPRGVDPELSNLRASWGEALCSFEALDPYGYGPEQTTTISATTGGVANAGDVDSDRIVLVVTGNGGTPAVTNTTAGGAVTFITTLAAGATRTLDVRARTVTGGGGYAELSPASSWFRLIPGNNILSLAGAASVAVTWRSAWM